MQLPIELLNVTLINGSVAGNLASSILEVKEALTMAVQVSWSGSAPSGSLILQGSCDGIIFTTLSSGTVNVTGNTGSAIINIVEKGISHIQAAYTASSGTGTLKVVINAKRA